VTAKDSTNTTVTDNNPATFQRRCRDQHRRPSTARHNTASAAHGRRQHGDVHYVVTNTGNVPLANGRHQAGCSGRTSFTADNSNSGL
jgi:hypothetical protein